MFPAGRWAEAFIETAGDDVENGIEVLSCFERCVKNIAVEISGLAAAGEASCFIGRALAAAGGEKSCGAGAARAVIFFLVKRGRLKEIGKLNEAARRLAGERAKIVNVRLEAAAEPDAAFIDAITASLKEKTGASGIALEVTVNTALLGGYRLTTGSEARDFSLAGKLKQLEAMLNVGSG